MRLYAIFCKNKPKSEYILIEFQAYFSWCRKQLDDNFHLSDYLIKPVQRITKYNLLLKSLRDYLLKENYKIGKNFLDAVEIMSVIPRNANDMMKVGRLENLPPEYDLPIELVLHDILLVNELAGNIKSEKQMNKNYERRKVFLFERILIFSEMRGSEEGLIPATYKFKNEIKVFIKIMINKNIDQNA
jgi:kalirin